MKIEKKHLIALAVVVGIASLGANVYYIGWDRGLKTISSHEQLGFNVALKQVYDKVKAEGSVKLGDIILYATPNKEAGPLFPTVEPKK